MIKWLVIGVLLFVGIIDFALIVVCSMWEDKETYMYEQWRKEHGRNKEK